MYPLFNSGDHVYFISAGPKIVSNPYPNAYPEYLGFEIQSVVSNNSFLT